ncbi:MAG: DUF6903 family protein [Faecousia sp.]
MQKFWKEHVALRLALIALFFILGIALVISGWKMTGQLAGLGIMLAGIVALLAAMFIYNAPFED